MPTYKYHLLDVFTRNRFCGNQLAVFTDGASVPDDLMIKFARELNLSESTFVMPAGNPSSDYRVRIFTPGREMPMAGHPTIGTAFLLAKLGMIPRRGNPTTAIFEEIVGDIPLLISYPEEWEGSEPSVVWMVQPSPTFGPVLEDRAQVLEALGLPAEAISGAYPVQVVSTGVPFIYVPLNTLADARAVRLNVQSCRELVDRWGADGLFVFTSEVETAGSTVHSRMFAPGLGVTEDPATGAASGPLGAYLAHYGLVGSPDQHMVSEQGMELGRPSYIHIEVVIERGEYTAVRVGGECCYMGRGQFEL